MSTTVETLRLVLVSSGSTGRELLAETGLEFVVVAPQIEKPAGLASKLGAVQRAEAAAYFNARVVAERVLDACVVGVETVVAVGRRVLSRPVGRLEAADMLRALSGRRHAVVSGVALVEHGTTRLIASEITYVTLLPMTEADIATHLASGRWVGQAGGYALDEMGDRFVLSIEGSLSNARGLPVELVGRMIDEIRHRPDAHRFA